MVEQYVKPWVWILTLKDKKKKKKKKAPCFKTPTNQAMWEPCQLQSPQDRAPHYLTMRHLTGRSYLQNTVYLKSKTQNHFLLKNKKCIVFTAWIPGASHKCRLSTFRLNGSDTPITTSEEIYIKNTSFNVTYLGLFSVSAICPRPRIHHNEVKTWPKQALK